MESMRPQTIEGDFVAESCDDSIVQVLQESDLGQNDVAVITIENGNHYTVRNINGTPCIASGKDDFAHNHPINSKGPIAELGQQFTYRGLIAVNSTSNDWSTGTVRKIEVRKGTEVNTAMIAAQMRQRAQYSVGQVVG